MTEQDKMIQVKKTLRSAYWAQKTLDDHVEYAARLRELAGRVGGVSYDKLPVHGGSGKGPALEEAVLNLVAYEQSISEDMNELLRCLRNVDGLIKLVPEDELRLLLEKRYKRFLTWEQVAAEMHYSWTWVHKQHKRALRAIAQKSV